MASLVSVANRHVAASTILVKGHGELGWPLLLSSVVRFSVKDQYPIRMGELRNGRSVLGTNPLPSMFHSDTLPPELSANEV